MSVVLFLCISFFLVLFVVNNEPAVMLTSPLALVLGGSTLIARAQRRKRKAVGPSGWN